MIKYVTPAFIATILGLNGLNAADVTPSYERVYQMLGDQSVTFGPHEEAASLVYKVASPENSPDSVRAEAVIGIVQRIAQGPRSADPRVRLTQVERAGSVIMSALAINVSQSKYLSFASEAEKSTFSLTVLQCALAYSAELRAGIIPGYVPVKAYGNIEPDIEPGDTPPQFVIGGMDPEAIADLKMRKRYIEKIKANERNNINNSTQSSYPEIFSRVVEISRTFISVNFPRGETTEAKFAQSLARLIAAPGVPDRLDGR